MWGQFWVFVFLTSAYPYKRACDSLLTLLPSPDHYHPLENQKPMCASILFLTLASRSHPHHKNPPFSSSYPHLECFLLHSLLQLRLRAIRRKLRAIALEEEEEVVTDKI
jgi:hypothetical protein